MCLNIKTYTGSILVAMNPFKQLDIYSQEYVQRYQGVRIGQLPPHIFAISDETHRLLTTKQENQCVVIRFDIFYFLLSILSDKNKNKNKNKKVVKVVQERQNPQNSF